MGPFLAKKNGEIFYEGNNLFKPIKNIKNIDLAAVTDVGINRVLNKKEMWSSLAKINSTIFFSTVSFFKEKGSEFVCLPLTTKMISSPGALYGKEKIDYTQDTTPIKLKWFNEGDVFLAESSQLYLELYLILNKVKSAFCIYNSFRAEKADFCHVPEFHHIEFESHLSQSENEKVVIELTQTLLSSLLENNLDSLKVFLNNEDIDFLESLRKNSAYKTIKLKEVLAMLESETGSEKYSRLSSVNWGSWEEIFSTNFFNKLLIVKEFPIKEVAFYHKNLKKEYDPVSGAEVTLADNSDFIFPGYREFVGSGRRVETYKGIEEKSVMFNLPRKDYEPYLRTRSLGGYNPSSGFGLGWERFLQGVLKMPTIVDTNVFPRVDFTNVI